MKTFHQLKLEVSTIAEAVMNTWTVTVQKPVNKLKKGDKQTVKARSGFEAINKAMKLWKDPALKAASADSFKITKEETVYENRELNNLKKKFKADLKKYENDGYFKNSKANQAFMDYALDNGEVKTDDPDEFEAWMDRDVLEATNPFTTAAKADRADAKLAKVNKKDDDKDRIKVANRKLKDARSKKYADAKKDLETKHGKGSDKYVKARDMVKKKLGIGESVDEALSPSYKNKYIGKDKASLRKTRNSFLTQIDDLIKFKKKTTKSPEVVKLQDLLKQVDFAIKGVKESVEINEVSKYDINDYRWPEIKFNSSSYANDAASALEKKMNWKSYDNWFDINGDKLEFSTYKLKEPEAIVAFKKATGIDLKRIR
jgi:hypothetical protein